VIDKELKKDLHTTPIQTIVKGIKKIKRFMWAPQKEEREKNKRKLELPRTYTP